MSQPPKGEPGRDRRVPFFLVAAVVVALLYYPTPEEYRVVPLGLAATYVVLALLTALDQRGRNKR